jgi:hypothetical protein
MQELAKVTKQAEVRRVADRLAPRVHLDRQVESDDGRHASEEHHVNVLEDAAFETTPRGNGYPDGLADLAKAQVPVDARVANLRSDIEAQTSTSFSAAIHLPAACSHGASMHDEAYLTRIRRTRGHGSDRPL